MIKRPYRCAFILGTALVLSAAVLMLRAHRDPAHPAARLALTVSNLTDNCATCHSTPSGEPYLTAQSDHAAPPQTEPDTALVDLGWRLLSLPERERERGGEVIAAYVALVDTAQGEAAQSAAARPAPIDAALAADGSTAPPLSADTLARWIDDLDAWVRQIENRAQPCHWVKPAAVTTPLMTVAFHDTPSAPPVAINPPAHWAMIQAATWIAAELPDLGLAYEIIFGTQRRGPPADAAYDSHLESVLGMRDCACAAYA